MLTPTLSPAPNTPSLTPIAPSQMANTPFTSDNLVSNHTVHRSVPPLSLSAHTIPPVVSSLSSHTISPPVSSLSSHTISPPVSSLSSHIISPPVSSLSSHTVPPVVSSLSHLPPGQPISQATSSQPVGHTPRCISIKPSKKVYLSSSFIQHNQLANPDTIIQKYRAYCVESKISTLAQRLAQDAYFGENVLKRCTVMGYRDKPALPWEELNNLKQKVFGLLPQFWNNPLDYESTWERCVVSIGQLCKRTGKK